MSRARRLIRLAPVLLAAALLLPAGLPVCGSDACPMPPAQRAACKAMGRDCCRSTGARTSHMPAPPQAPAELAPLFPTLPALATGLLPAAVRAPEAAPAVLQGVGLHTLFAVFLI